MDGKFAPVAVGSFATDPINLLLAAIVVIVAVVLLFGARREVATMAIAVGVIGALMAA
ncbi:MAG: hypothetical protein AAGB15_04485 [Pseudomonadota bacterium]